MGFGEGDKRERTKQTIIHTPDLVMCKAILISRYGNGKIRYRYSTTTSLPFRFPLYQNHS